MATEQEKQAFSDQLKDTYDRCSSHTPTFVVGYLNARINGRLLSEAQYIGTNIFGKVASAVTDDWVGGTNAGQKHNRTYLSEFCEANHFVIANTFLKNKDSRTVTYREPGTPHMSALDHPWDIKDYNVLDHCLINQRWRNIIQSIKTYPELSLSTWKGHSIHHYFAVAKIKLTVGASIEPLERPPKYDFNAMTEDHIS